MIATLERDEVDAGLKEARSGVARLCLATREVTPVEAMIRYVAGPDGNVVPDLGCRLPGRGAWVTATRAALEKAMADRAFARAFRGKGTAAKELPDLVERLLEKTALDSLSLANKAGAAVTGFARIEAALAGKAPVALLHAREASPDGIRKLDSAVRAAGSELPARVNSFTGAQLDLALGRSNVVHAALLPHPVSGSFLARCLRLDRWRNGGLAGAGISGRGEKSS